MKIRIQITFDLTPEQLKVVTETAKSMGFDYDGTTDPRVLIRRYAEERVEVIQFPEPETDE